MHSGVVATRKLAREIRIRRLDREARSLQASLKSGHAPEAAIVDHIRASRAAASFVANPTDAALSRIAITENAQAYSDVQVLPVPGSAIQYFRQWDARLDACALCWARDGETVPLGRSFPDGEPGEMHPHCRCTWSLISELELETPLAA